MTEDINDFNQLQYSHKYIVDAVTESSRHGERILLFNFGSDKTIAATNCPDPNMLIPSLTNLMNDQVISNREDPNNANTQGGVITYALVNSVLNHFKDLQIQQDHMKFNKFLSGDLSELTNDDIDRFIELKRSIKKVKLLYKKINSYTILTSHDNTLLLVLASELRLFNFKFQYQLGKYQLLTEDDLTFDRVKFALESGNINGELVELIEDEEAISII